MHPLTALAFNISLLAARGIRPLADMALAESMLVHLGPQRVHSHGRAFQFDANAARVRDVTRWRCMLPIWAARLL